MEIWFRSDKIKHKARKLATYILWTKLKLFNSVCLIVW